MTAGVEQRDRGADAMRMAPGVPIRMVLGVVEHICAIKPARMCRHHAGREVTYDSRRTRFTGAGAVDRCRRRAGRASFAKKKPDLACRGRDLSPDVRRCAWCASWEMGVPRWCVCQWARKSEVHVRRVLLFNENLDNLTYDKCLEICAFGASSVCQNTQIEIGGLLTQELVYFNEELSD